MTADDLDPLTGIGMSGGIGGGISGGGGVDGGVQQQESSDRRETLSSSLSSSLPRPSKRAKCDGDGVGDGDGDMVDLSPPSPCTTPVDENQPPHHHDYHHHQQPTGVDEEGTILEPTLWSGTSCVRLFPAEDKQHAPHAHGNGNGSMNSSSMSEAIHNVQPLHHLAPFPQLQPLVLSSPRDSVGGGDGEPPESFLLSEVLLSTTHVPADTPSQLPLSQPPPLPASTATPNKPKSAQNTPKKRLSPTKRPASRIDDYFYRKAPNHSTPNRESNAALCHQLEKRIESLDEELQVCFVFCFWCVQYI